MESAKSGEILLRIVKYSSLMQMAYVSGVIPISFCQKINNALSSLLPLWKIVLSLLMINVINVVLDII
jgi:hypothetical protein